MSGPMDAIASLEEWTRIHDAESRRYYEFSPAWDGMMEHIWTEYAKLESCRVAASLPRQPWQQGVEDERDSMASYRQRLYKPWEGRLMQFCPLWTCLDRKDISEYRHVEYPWQAALSYWEDFENRRQSNPGFYQSLSASQVHSYEILRDWWQARYCDKSLVEKMKVYMKWLGEYRLPPSHPKPDSHEVLRGADLSAMESKSRYEYRCFKLFVTEFHPGVWSPYIAKVNVNIMVFARRFAAQCAIAQRLSFPILSRGGRAPAQYPKISLSPITTSTGPPYYLWDAKNGCTIETSRIEISPVYACISHTWGRWVDRQKPPFKMAGVPWPVPRVKPERFDVRKLPKELKKLGCRYIWIDLFCIPQAPVEPWSHGYPQDTVLGWKERADDEIARQSSIFHGSFKCIAWLNDVPSWKDTRRALGWMGLYFLEKTGFVCQKNSQKATRKLGFVDYEAYNHQGNPQGSRPRIKIGWFTSLWTLQEAVLCPDMELFAADWSQLADDWGSPITLRTLMVFCDQCHHLDGRKSWPESPFELSELQYHSSLASIFITESPTVICSITNTRTCSGPPQDRAPAIMSAIGVTDWWRNRDVPVTNQFGEREVPSQAVLDSYPLGFLQEAAQKIGATFYHTVIHGCNLHDDTTREMIVERSRLDVGLHDTHLQDEFTKRHDSRLGTMLPFKKPGSLQSWTPGESLEFPHTDMVDHPSVSSWHICGDGSVRILQAGIFSTSSRQTEQTERIAANVYCSSVLMQQLKDEIKGSDGQSDLDLSRVLRLIAGDDTAYAVTLYTEGISHYGVILFGPECHDTTTQYLVKLGIYSTVEVPTPETSRVDWVVL